MRPKYFCLMVFFLCASPLFAVDYVVSPTGDDDNPGTAVKPWRTIQKAAETLEAGDKILIRAGTYQEQVHPVHSGTKVSPITYQAYPGEKPVVEGKGVKLPSDWDGLFRIDGLSYIHVVGLTIQDSGPSEDNAGILVEKSDHIVIQGNRTYNTVSSGIGVWRSRDILIDGNEVELACNDGSQECISVAQTDGFEVRNNEVHNGGPGHRGAEGIDAKDGACHGTIHGNHVHHLNRVGIYVDAWDKPTHDIEVFNNVSHDNQADGMALASENGGILERVKVHHNLVYRNKHNGIDFAGWGEPVPHHPIRNLEVCYNIFWGNGVGKWGGGIMFQNKEARDIRVHDNILSDNHSFQIAQEIKPVQASITHNLIHGFRDYEGETRGEDFVEGDPLFKDPSTGDFQLLPGSPAKGFDAGVLK